MVATYQEMSALISPEILQAVEKIGFTEMTEVQRKAIPVMLEGKDVIAKAPTGTGKTCAFGVPMIERIDPGKKDVQGLVLCPTRSTICRGVLSICVESASPCSTRPTRCSTWAS